MWDYEVRVIDGRKNIGRLIAVGSKRITSRNIDFGNVVIANTEGSITYSAIKWLSMNSIPVVSLDWDGEIISIKDPPYLEGIKRLRQYDAYLNNRIEVGRDIITGK
ncbi:hypothetical protein IX51_08575 [uncultured archaeon]|nr:hypothetical protein IX51_08575 [uncultured archaeon]